MPATTTAPSPSATAPAPATSRPPAPPASSHASLHLLVDPQALPEVRVNLIGHGPGPDQPIVFLHVEAEHRTVDVDHTATFTLSGPYAAIDRLLVAMRAALATLPSAKAPTGTRPPSVAARKRQELHGVTVDRSPAERAHPDDAGGKPQGFDSNTRLVAQTTAQGGPMSYSQSPGAAALAYPTCGLPILACHWPTPTELPQFCSCGALDCPTPARHPLGTLTPHDATRDLAQLARWWQATPAANPATLTDPTHLGVIELHHPANPDRIVQLLNLHTVDPCPVIAAPGRLHLLVRPDPTAAAPDPTAASNGTLTSHAPGTLLLPPSRLMSGQRLRWIRRLSHTTRLRPAASVLVQLRDVLATGALDALHPLLTK